MISNEILVNNPIVCDSYNITFISSRTTSISENITSGLQYISRIISIFLGTFDDQLSKIECPTESSSTIYHYYPTVSLPYSLLDMTHGKELIEAGYHNHTVDKYYICI